MLVDEAQARRGEDRQHFWRYCDLKTHTILDNRYLVANLIQSEPSTLRVVEPGALSGVFALQEESDRRHPQIGCRAEALETAPRTGDPVQQTVATAIQGYLNHPDLDRKEAIELIRFLNQPMLSIQQLRPALRNFKAAGQVKGLIEEVQKLRGIVAEPEAPQHGGDERRPIRRKDLRVICFEFVGGG